MQDIVESSKEVLNASTNLLLIFAIYVFAIMLGRQHNSEKSSLVIFPKFRTVTNPKKLTSVIFPKI